MRGVLSQEPLSELWKKGGCSYRNRDTLPRRGTGILCSSSILPNPSNPLRARSSDEGRLEPGASVRAVEEGRLQPTFELGVDQALPEG